MSGLEISSFVHLGWKKGKRAEARFLFLVTLSLSSCPFAKTDLPIGCGDS